MTHSTEQNLKASSFRNNVKKKQRDNDDAIKVFFFSMVPVFMFLLRFVS